MKETVYRINGRFEFTPSQFILKNRQTSERKYLEPLMGSVLTFLINNRDRVVSRTELIDRFWDPDSFGDEALTKVISKLRKELGDNTGTSGYIKTRSKMGYEWVGIIEEPASLSSRVVRAVPIIQFNRRTITGLTLILFLILVIKSIFIPHH